MPAPTPRKLIDRLQNVPARLARAFSRSRALTLDAALAAGEWSAAEVLAHLRASDDILASRAHMMLARDNPPLPTFDERRWAEVAGYARRDVLESLQMYTLRRHELVAMLREQPPEAWARTGQHEARGAVTLLDALTTLVEHEEEHCAQIEAAGK